MIKVITTMNTPDRAYLNFVEETRKAFRFLNGLGFYETEALPTIVRYRKGDIEVDVYHGRQSYEIGVGVTAFGTRYTIGEIIRLSNPEIEKHFRYPIAFKPEVVAVSLEKLSLLMKQYGLASLNGDPQYFSMLENQAKLWIKEYALEVLAEQLRPKAEEAFRQKKYAEAASLYSRFKDCLSPTEIKKMSIAEKRSKS